MSSRSKIQNREQLAIVAKNAQKQGKKVGFTSGTFDLLHPGHVDYLEQARAKVDLLIVGVNSDASVRAYKSPDRPVISEHDRITLLAALACVDHVFLFNELNNNENVYALKPDLYIKAGDYQRSELSSASLVEQNGGQVLIIPLLKGFSSTAIIEQIQGVLGSEAISEKKTPRSSKKLRAVFIDRDGTINEEVEYLHQPIDVQIIARAGEGIKALQDAGFKIVIVTNQPGIGFGYFTRQELFKVNKQILSELNKSGALVDKFLFCPHTKADQCECRKPKPGMLKRAALELGVDLSQSYMIGDSNSDIEAGKAAGCKTILVQTGKAGKDGLQQVEPDLVCSSLFEASQKICVHGQSLA